MKLFLIDNDKITKYKLPEKVDESYLISYSNETVKDSLISFTGIDNKWYLESNGAANIIINGQIVDQIEIKTYQKYYLKIIGINELVIVYFLPTIEKIFRLSFSNLTSFSVGNSNKCNIFYDSQNLDKVHAVFKMVNQSWWISSPSEGKLCQWHAY